MGDATGSTTAVSTPQDRVDSLMREMAEEANIELQQDLTVKEVSDLAPHQRAPAVGEEDGNLADRLRAACYLGLPLRSSSRPRPAQGAHRARIQLPGLPGFEPSPANH